MVVFRCCCHWLVESLEGAWLYLTVLGTWSLLDLSLTEGRAPRGWAGPARVSPWSPFLDVSLADSFLQSPCFPEINCCQVQLIFKSFQAPLKTLGFILPSLIKSLKDFFYGFANDCPI